MKEIQIIYEDNDILVVNKPAGLLVHGLNSLVDWLVEKYPNIKSVGEDPERPGIVHRLDKDTSGVLLIAKNQKSFEYLKEQFQERKVKKKYLALVYGSIKNNSGIIDLPIGRSAGDARKKSALGKIKGKIREAITEYRVLRRFKDFTLLEAYPKTGRMHQIRVHFKAIGHPIVCDKLYGPKKQKCPFGLTRHFLHANSVELNLLSGERVKIEADLTQELQNVLDMINCSS